MKYKIKDMDISTVIWDWCGTIMLDRERSNHHAISAITAFQKIGIMQGIISNQKDEVQLRAEVEQIGLDRFFNPNYIVCAGGKYPPKPATDMYKIFSARLPEKIDPLNLLFIGDSDSDRAFAARIGCNFLHVSELERKGLTKREE